MKTEYKYIHFAISEKKPKTDVWDIRTNDTNDLLGQIKWYGAWRGYCVFTKDNVIFHYGCWQDVADFWRQLNEERKNAHNTP